MSSDVVKLNYRPLRGGSSHFKKGFPNPGQKGGGGDNYMSPFKCIDRPKKKGGSMDPPMNIHTLDDQNTTTIVYNSV